MRVLFLDIDGVLNSMRFFAVESKRGYRKSKAATKWGYDPTEALDPDAVALLNQIVEQTGCKVVISSSWRKPFNLDEIGGFLRAVGFVGEVIASTPIFPSGGPRGDEISWWVNVHQDGVEQFAILDDCSDMADVKPWLVQTDTATGLLPEHVERVVFMLGSPTISCDRCRLRGPLPALANRIDAAGGPECHCGAPSASESGACERCARAVVREWEAT